MGAKGSGRHYRFDTRLYTDDYLNLDIRLMNQRGWLNKTGYQNLSWKRNGQEIGLVHFLVWTRVQFPDDMPSIRMKYKSRINGGDWQELDYEIKLDVTLCNFGGVRYWFKCPQCNKRACVLYGGTIFKCRYCHDLVHKSRNESSLDQTTRRINKEKDKLWPELDLDVFDSVRYLEKPKWKRQATYMKKKIELLRLESKLTDLMIEKFGCAVF